jgi:hypothetical protein
LFATGDLHHIGFALIGDDGIKHAFERGQVAKLRPVRAAVGIADGAAQVAVVGDLQDRQARVLHVIRAQAAVIGAAVFHRRVETQRHLRRLDVHLAALAPVVGIGRDQHLAVAVFAAPLVHPHLVVLDDELGFDAAQALGAQRGGGVVEKVGAGFGHG